MRQSLRRTLAPLYLTYGDDEASEALLGRRFGLDVDEGDMLLSIDLTPNFQTRKKSAPGYVEAQAFTRSHARLRALECDDNLVRTRLVRAWEAQRAPRLRLLLDLGPRGRFVYAARPRLRFTGGVRLEVLRAIEALVPAPGEAQAV